MSFNINKKGHPVCVIENGEYDGTKVYLSDEMAGDKIQKNFEKLELDGKSTFQVIPDTKKERDVFYIVGQSGSGKSYWLGKFIAEYKKAYPKRDVFVFSNLSEDKSLGKHKIHRILIGDNLLTEPLTVEDFKDSLVIFDDCDVISNKAYKEAVYQIANEILETGRHHNVSCGFVSHLATGSNLKRILNEAHSFIYFPWGATRNTHYVLENYIGINKDDIKKIKSTKSRWCCIHKNYPQCVVTEKKIWTVASDI